jgi:hypothetical protein
MIQARLPAEVFVAWAEIAAAAARRMISQSGRYIAPD